MNTKWRSLSERILIVGVVRFGRSGRGGGGDISACVWGSMHTAHAGLCNLIDNGGRGNSQKTDIRSRRVSRESKFHCITA